MTTVEYETAAEWQRARAHFLHSQFLACAQRQELFGIGVTTSIKQLAKAIDGRPIVCKVPGGSKVLKASFGATLAAWYNWIKGGPAGRRRDADARKPGALIHDYKPGVDRIPRELRKEIHRRATQPTGGRDKHGRSPISVVYRDLCADFHARVPIPGIDYNALPDGAEFPYCQKTIYRHKPKKDLMAMGNRGMAAFKGESAYISLDYSKLKKCELYTADDVRLDIMCFDEATGKAIRVVCYLLMEVASRAIVAYILKPRHAIKQEDVDELIAHGLQAPGYGVGIGYVTHIKLERGTTAMSEAARMTLEGATDGGIKIHRTGMNGGIRWVGAHRDKASGNAAGKAVIESFMRRLHYALLHLPGQRGNNYENQPANLGLESEGRSIPAKIVDGKVVTPAKITPGRITPGSLIAECEKLAAWNLASGNRLHLKLGMLYLKELNTAVDAAIKTHNNEPGHAYQGHGTFEEAEIAPGVWKKKESPE